VSNRSSSNHCINISSTHAECDALIETIKEVLWFTGFLRSLYIEIKDPTILYVDNKPVVTLSEEGNHLKRSKHFVVKTAYVKELVQMRVIKVKHLAGTKNHADIHTKPLFGELLEFHTVGILGKN
jgi:hypothetical protein